MQSGIQFQCRTYTDKINVTAVEQVVICDVSNGFICQESDQRHVCNNTVTNRCCCNSYEVRVCCVSRGWIHKLVPPPPVYDVVPLKKRIYSHLLPPEKPRIAVYRPPGCICVDLTIRIECCRKYTEIMYLPKLIVKYPPPTRQMTQRYHPTTVRAYIKMPQVKYYINEINIRPQIYHVPPIGCICRNMTISIECCIYKQRIYPTHVHRVWKKPKIQHIWDTVLLPQTRIWEKRIQPTVHVWKLLPTTVQDIYFPQQRDIIFDQHVNNPPHLIHYPPKMKWYTDRVAPQPTSVRRRTPPSKSYWVNVPLVYDVHFYPIATHAVGEMPEPHTSIEKYTQPGIYVYRSGKDFIFPLPKMRTVTSCYRVTRAREVCTSEWLQYWLALIRNCTVERLRRRGCLLGPQLDRETIQQLQAAAAVCIRIIGDTSCRDDRFSLMELMFEREFIIVGRIEENYHFHPNVSDELKKCVVLINEKKMNACFPGFHTLLLDLLLHGKMNLTLDIDKYHDPSCVMQQMEHCRPSDLETLEELIYSIFGTCIKLCPSSERGGGCSYDALRFRYCDSIDIRNFIQDVHNCIADSSGQQKFQKLPLKKRIVIVINCLIRCHPNCILSKWTVFKEILSYLIEVLTGEDIDYDMNPDVTLEDMCVPLHLSENSSSVKYVIQRSCRGYDIGKWLNATKSCMTGETKKIGLKNPDLLTIEKIMHLLQHCISTQDNLKCHPKGRREYRLLLSSFLNIIRRFSVISNASTCPQDLIIENIGKCQTSLYSFLLLKYESSIMKDRKTAFEGWEKIFKNCSSEIVESKFKKLRMILILKTG
ncbi:hypothetical protein HNY73_014187 [Argiope bruennichi]|uniref:Uncharacterized protein n=1 Tax=Argiope bruennichi TaxID=94029 RepID=A0A8T0END9_ARGBR|nr:hypothetical protein HNY73_014187 [Argiope bruennichi]